MQSSPSTVSLLDQGARLWDTEYRNTSVIFWPWLDRCLPPISWHSHASEVIFCFCKESCAFTVNSTAIVWLPFATRKQLSCHAINSFPGLPRLWQTHRQTDRKLKRTSQARCMRPAGKNNPGCACSYLYHYNLLASYPAAERLGTRLTICVVHGNEYTPSCINLKPYKRTSKPFRTALRKNYPGFWLLHVHHVHAVIWL